MVIMRAVYVDRPGEHSTIHDDQLPDPVPSTGQVLVRPAAIAVNTVDTLVRSGRWRTEVATPTVLGRDLVGSVVSVGPDVAGFEVGQQVWTNSAGYGGRAGATAELVPVDVQRAYPLPAGADPQRFVAALHPGATAVGVLVDRAQLQPGESVAVVGANGAVGMCLIQVAVAHGAREVIAVVRDRRSEAVLRSLGATQVVIADAATAVAEAAGASETGVDVLVDSSGRVDLSQVPEQLNPRGRMVLIAGRDRRWELDPWLLYTREISLLGFIMSAMDVGELARAAEWINDQHAERPLKVSVGEVLDFSAADRAYADVAAGRLSRMPDGTVGRLILCP